MDLSSDAVIQAEAVADGTEQPRHFLALVEERSITRAAKRELIVQSGLSNSLQALERELGMPLHHRGTRAFDHRGWRGFGWLARRTLTSAARRSRPCTTPATC